MPESNEDAALVEATEIPANVKEALAYLDGGGLMEVVRFTDLALSMNRRHVQCDTAQAMALCYLAAEALAARARRDEGGDDALIEAIAQAIHDTDDMADTVWPDGEDDNGYRGGDGWVRLCLNPEAYRLAARRALRLSRAHDAPTLATLTASLAEAEARAEAMHRRAQIAEGALAKANELLALADSNDGKSSRNTVRYYRKWQEAEARGGRAEAAVERLRPYIDALPAGVWETWTACSNRRITAKAGPDGGVLHAYNQRSDGHPDLSWTERECQAICEIVNAIRAALQETPHGR